MLLCVFMKIAISENSQTLYFIEPKNINITKINKFFVQLFTWIMLKNFILFFQLHLEDLRSFSSTEPSKQLTARETTLNQLKRSYTQLKIRR